MTQPTKIGRYEIVERVGRGGMGAVYRGRDTVLDREVAIKVMSGDFAAEETARPRFYREARAAAKLQHRNIVTVFEFGEEDQTPYIVMEFLRGQDLSKRMHADPPMTLEQKLDVVAELCTGLHFAHEQGVIHRDVKPANIWLSPDDAVKLLDFGIAKFSSSTMTRQGAVLGSIAYMAPEQVTGSDVDGRADVFSAGVVLYELLSGRKPFDGDSPTAVLAQIMDDEPAPIKHLPPDIPKALTAAVAKALQKDREKRYRHAADFGADLRLVRSALAAANDAADAELAATIFSEGPPADLGATIAQEPAGSIDLVTRPPAPAPLVTRQPSSTGWMVPAGVALGVVLVVGGWFLASRSSNPARQPAPGTAAPASAETGTMLVRITSEPAGASIAVDGRETGRVTPADVPLDTAEVRQIRLSRPGFPPLDAPVTPEEMKANRVPVLRLPGRGGATRPAAVPAGLAGSDSGSSPGGQGAPAARVIVQLSGTYPFSVWQGGQQISASGNTHQVEVAAPVQLRVRSEEFFLDRTVAIDGSRRTVPWSAPEIGFLSLRASPAFETCTVVIGGRDLTEPPIENLRVAAGSYTVQLRCPDGQSKQVPVTVVAGQPNPYLAK